MKERLNKGTFKFNIPALTELFFFQNILGYFRFEKTLNYVTFKSLSEAYTCKIERVTTIVNGEEEAFSQKALSYDVLQSHINVQTLFKKKIRGMTSNGSHKVLV